MSDGVDQGQEPPRDRSGRKLVAVLVVFVAGVSLYFALGMPGMNHGAGTSMDGMDMGGGPAATTVDASAFERLITTERGATLINVHVPYAGEIQGTDLFVPYNAIDPAQLPADKTQPLLVYCETGDMSAVAATALRSLGYTSVTELLGGMRSWQASGRWIVEGAPQG